MPGNAKRYEIAKAFFIWTKPGSTKIWIEASKKWAHAIVTYDAWALATLVTYLVPFPFGAILGTYIMLMARWHGKKLKKSVGPNGIWIGIDPAKFVGDPVKSIAWFKNIDARPRTASNKGKEPMPW